MDIESYSATNNSRDKMLKTWEYDAILHYLKMASTLKASNINNNADSNNKEKVKDTSPTLQVNPNTIDPINTCLHSVCSGNLSQKVLLKASKNIQQSGKRSCINSHEDKILGTFSHQNLNSLILRSNSNELMVDFNTKTKEITKAMQELHFSTTDLRNKPSKGRVNNNSPIIAQITGKNNITTTAQVKVEIYLPAQSCWREIRGFLHKEMNLCITSTYYEVLNKNDIYPPWTIAFQPP